MHTWIWLAIGLASGWIAGAIALRRGGRGASADTARTSGAIADLDEHIKQLGAHEREVIMRLIHRERASRDPNKAFDEQMTLGQRLADRVAAVGGSWTFIGVFLLGMAVWMAINSATSIRFDPYPFILLNLALSCLAALQAPVIMMSQNRSAAKDRMDAHHDYEVNLRAEMEIERLHARLDDQRATDWQELLRLQNRQIELLQSIAGK